jgi:hypothetical protein
MKRLRYACIAVVGIGMILGLGGRAIADATTAPSTTRPTWPPADVAAPKLDKNGQIDLRFLKMHESFLQRRTQGPIGVLFLGDSITELWSSNGKEVWAHYYAKLNAANFGISGDQTRPRLW